MNFETLAAVLEKIKDIPSAVVEIYVSPALEQYLASECTRMSGKEMCSISAIAGIRVSNLSQVFIDAGIQFALVRSDGSISMYNNFGGCVIESTLNLFVHGIGERVPEMLKN